ncbi:MAG: glycosyltransferase family 2 protein [Deltaproteobacteria bacterium]|nr:glycosyltransferase family 2 protein [Deltaproteobacteria bacterium]
MADETVDIVIPLYNQIDYTRRCLSTLRGETDGPFRLILVDNGSTDGTVEYLGCVRDAVVVTNGRNAGVAAAWNQGLSLSKGRWIVVLNNDTVLPAGWLRRLVGFCARENVQVASPSMREGELNYDLEKYAGEFVRAMEARRRMGVADGACFVVDRQVIGKIGVFDERFHPASYEDSDFFRRAKNAGFRLAVTGASFIHHFGFATQKRLPADEEGADHRLRNREYYCDKWGLAHPDGNWLEKRKSRILGFYRRKAERILTGHSVKEKWIGGRIVYR